MADTNGGGGGDAVAPPVDEPVQKKRKFNLSQDQKTFLGLILKREGSHAFYTFMLLLVHFTGLTHVSWPLTGWSFFQLGFFGLFFLALTMHLMITQVNAVVVATDEDAPIKDAQGTNDLGWSIWTVAGFLVIYGGTAVAWLLGVAAPDFLPNWVERSLTVSWILVAYTPFGLAALYWDFKVNGPLFQRINSLRGRRLVESMHGGH
jgi:hypothetical protein